MTFRSGIYVVPTDSWYIERSAATGFCIMANGLYWTGAEPRLNPEKETTLSNVPPAETPEPLPQG